MSRQISLFFVLSRVLTDKSQAAHDVVLNRISPSARRQPEEEIDPAVLFGALQIRQNQDHKNVRSWRAVVDLAHRGAALSRGDGHERHDGDAQKNNEIPADDEHGKPRRDQAHDRKGNKGK